MKKITLLFAAAVMALSCSDDDNAPVSLDGTWKLTNINLNREGYDLNKDGVVSENFIEEFPCMGESTLNFKDESNADFIMSGISDGQSRTAMDTPFPCPMKTPENVTYTINGNTVEFTYTTQTIHIGTKIKRKFMRSGNKITATMIMDGSDIYIPGSGEIADTYTYANATFEFTKQ